MPSELKTTVNIRISNDMNLSFSMIHIDVTTDEEAQIVGRRDAELISAYVLGYCNGVMEEN